MCSGIHSSSGLTGHQNHLRIPADTCRQYAKVKASYTITYMYIFSQSSLVPRLPFM